MTSFLALAEQNLTETKTISIQFVPLNDDEGLPFPLNLDSFWNIFFVLSYLITLYKGTKLRVTIISYLNSPESNLGPINYLIWVDQVNSCILSVSILARILYMISPFPFSSVFPLEVCQLLTFVGLYHMGGSYMWGTCIAVFRVLFVTAQKSLKKLGIKRVLNVMLFLGVVEGLSYGVTSQVFDEEIPTFKMCTHLSFHDHQIFKEYLVRPLNSLFNY